MSRKVKRYTSDGVDVTYDVKRCIHAAECVRGLPAVFDTDKRPWIQPDQAPADAVAEVVMRCPTGALHFERKDGGSAEPAPTQNRIVIAAHGPLYVRGDVTLVEAEATTRDTRLALCRCGASKNKPYCDNSHKETGFTHAGQIARDSSAEADSGEGLEIKPSSNGPLLLRGSFELISADGATVFRGEKAALCRCGGSADKPFCDGSHTRINFNSEGEE